MATLSIDRTDSRFNETHDSVINHRNWNGTLCSIFKKVMLTAPLGKIIKGPHNERYVNKEDGIYESQGFEQSPWYLLYKK